MSILTSSPDGHNHAQPSALPLTSPSHDHGSAIESPNITDSGDLDLSLLKKKKKKKSKVAKADDNAFAAKLQELRIADVNLPNERAAEPGDMKAGTGIWAHNETTPIAYNQLLGRLFGQLSQQTSSSLRPKKSSKIPPPQCTSAGRRKTVFINFADICTRLKRSETHLSGYLFAELGTDGSVDGSNMLVIKGRFQQKQIEGIIRKYIVEYVNCHTCKALNTELCKGESRLYFVECHQCGSRRSVTPIKAGFSAQIGKRKKK